MIRKEKVRIILLAGALTGVIMLAFAIQGHWWTRLTQRPPGPTQSFVCTNARCGRHFRAEVVKGREMRCPECKWLARPATPARQP
jgi:hypothetical protein